MAKVYVSSTLADLEAEREAVMDWLVSAGHQPVHSYRPDSETVRESCLEDIDGCDLYVLILGHRYGFQPEEDNTEKLSITHLEFRRAKRIPRIALLRTSVPNIRLSDLLDPLKAPLVRAFDDEVRREVRPAEFTDLAALIQGLSTGIQYELEKLRPVVTTDDPRTLQIVATLTDELARKSRLIDERETENVALRGRVKQLEEELLRSAVARTLTAAAQPDASKAQIDAASALEAGDPRPAEVLLGRQEREEAAHIGMPGADDAARRREAAALAREQGSLAMGDNVAAALSAFERAAEYEPEDAWTRFFIGDLQLRLGNLDAAMQSFRSGIASVEARLQACADDSVAQRDLSVSLERIGNVLVAQGDGPGGLQSYRKSLEISEALAAHDPANTEWQHDISVSHTKIGDVLLAQGDGSGGLQSYRKSLEICEVLAARDPANTLWQRDLSVSHERIGNVLVDQGDGSGGLQTYRKALEIREALLARDPANTEWQRDLSVSHTKIGDMLVAQGDGPGGLEAYSKFLKILEALVARDPANTIWQRDFSVGHERIGDVLVAQGDGPGAEQAYRKSLEIREVLAARDPANAEWQRDLTVSHNKIGDVLVAQGDGPGGLEVYRKALEIREALAAQDPANSAWQRDLSVSHERIGDVLTAEGDEPGALQAHRKALEIGEALAARDPANTQWQRDLAISCVKLGTLAHAQNEELRRMYLLRGREILAELKEKGRLLPSQDWIEWFDNKLAELPPDSE